MTDLEQARKQLESNLSGSEVKASFPASIPRAKRAEPKLTFHKKQIYGFWQISGKPGIWTWRGKAKLESIAASPDRVIAVTRAMAYSVEAKAMIEVDEQLAVFGRELTLEQFFGLKGVNE